MKTEIINYLKNVPDFVSGQEISNKFQLSRAAIWKNVEELRKEGYSIEAISRRGYCLRGVPDKIISRELQFDLKTKVFGKKAYCFDSLESTMGYAFTLALQGEEEGAVVCAETQTKGKGRMGRSWESPKARGIYFSLILRPKRSINEVLPLTLLSAVAICETIEKMTSLKAQIKWPNDVFINGKKIAGILTEMNAEMDRVKFLVAGIGININTPISQLPITATSLKAQWGKPVSRIGFFQELLCRLEYWYFLSLEDGMGAVLNAWKDFSLTLGKPVSITDAHRKVEGVAVDIDKNGGLLVRQSSGEIIRFMSGDIVEMRQHV